MNAHLNDDVETDLTLPPDQLVELPAVQSDTPTVTLQTPVPATGTRPLNTPSLMPPTLPGQIPQLKAQFDLISDKAHHLVDLKEVESMLLDQKSVSQESAQVVDDYFGGLFNPRLPKSSFTQLPSLTNYNYVVRYAREFLDRKMPELVDQYKLSLTELHQLYNEFLEQYDHHWGEIEAGRHDVMAHYSDLIEQIQFCPDCVVPIHAESGESVTTDHPQFINLLDYPLVQFNVNALKLLASKRTGPFNDVAFYQGMHSIQHLLRSETLIHWITLLVKSVSETPSILPDNVDIIQLRDRGKELTLRTVLRFYESSQSLDALKQPVYDLLAERLVVIEQNAVGLSGTDTTSQYIQTQQQLNTSNNVSALQCLELASDGMHRLMELNQAIVHVLHALVYFVPKAD
jgi:hypothetical protein